jgi:hypothetical protein
MTCQQELIFPSHYTVSILWNYSFYISEPPVFPYIYIKLYYQLFHFMIERKPFSTLVLQVDPHDLS